MQPPYQPRRWSIASPSTATAATAAAAAAAAPGAVGVLGGAGTDNEGLTLLQTS